MEFTCTARALATVANQPTFDAGGFPIRQVRQWGGEDRAWETLYDQVTLVARSTPNKGVLVVLENDVSERGVGELSTEIEQHTAGRLLRAVLAQVALSGMPWDGLTLHLKVKKGLSLKGTGLGSSGATPAAALKAFEGLCERMGRPIVLTSVEKIQALQTADFGVPDNSVPAYFGGLTVLSPHFERLEKSSSFGTLVAVTPEGFGIKTEDARRVLQGHAAPREAEEWVQAMREAWAVGDTLAYAQAMERAHAWFVEPRHRLYPGEGASYRAMVEAAKQAGALGVTISGSGPTVVAWVDGETMAEAVAKAMQSALKSWGFESVARWVDVESQGAYLV